MFTIWLSHTSFITYILNMRTVYFALFLFCFCFQAQSQLVEIDTTNNDLRVSSLPYYNYGKGLGITAPDSLFQLNLRFRMQNRATYFEYEDEDDVLEAKIRRLRLRFDGYVGNPQFLYVIQLSFAPDDVGEIQQGRDFNVIRDAIVMYRPTEKWNFIFGQTKLPGNRQRVNSSGALQLTDRSINNANFNIDRDFGVQAHYLNSKNNAFSYHLKAAISSGKGRNFTDNQDTGTAFTAKAEIFPMGVFKRDGRYFEGDILREERPKLMLSGAIHQNNKSIRDRGQVGFNLFDAKRLRSSFVDVLFKYSGFAASFAYMSRNSDDVFSFNPNDATDFRFVYVGEGYDTQLSYVLPSNYELIARYSSQHLRSEIRHLAPNQQEIAFGITRYIWEHSFKVQTEISQLQVLPYSGPSIKEWYLRFQIEIGI